MRTVGNIYIGLFILSISNKVKAYQIPLRTTKTITLPHSSILPLHTNALIRNSKTVQHSTFTAMRRDIDGIEQLSKYKKSTNIDNCDRREALSFSFNCVKSASITTTLTASFLALNPSHVKAETPVNPVNIDTELTAEDGLLESRVTENLLSPPTYGLEDPDIYYPE